MHKSDESSRKTSNWPTYLAIGCGVVILLVIISAFLFYWFFVRPATAIFKQALNPTPIVRTKPYNFGYQSIAASASLTLPDGYGTLTYMHGLMKKGNAWGSDGQRAISIVSSTGRNQQWPLPYCCTEDVRVGVYWYPQKNGEGPFLRFYDVDESFLDLKRMEVGEVQSEKGKLFLGFYSYDDIRFISGITCHYDSAGNIIGMTGADGKPAIDVTNILISSNRKYIGSIIRKGNRLIFTPANTKKIK